MPNNLEKVFKRINRSLGQRLKVGERDVAKRFAKTLAEIRALMAGYYEKYEQGGKLTYAEMAKFDRMGKFMREVEEILTRNYKDVYKAVQDVLGDVYQEGYYLTAWAVETVAMAKLAYSAVKSETILAMINNPINGLTLKQNLEKKRADIIHAIQQQVTQGLVKGETYSSMAKRIKGALDGDATKAVRVVRTEGHRVMESSKLDAMEYADKQGVKSVKTWNTLEDSRVRTKTANHAKLNNKTIPVDQNFSDGLGRGPAPGQLGAAGSDINCRCFLTYEVQEVTKVQHEDLAEITFDEWKKERLKK